MITDARLYLVAPARVEAGPIADLIPELVAAGVDLFQLREKDMEAGELIRVGEPIRVACATAGIPFIVNDDAEVAAALDADGLHVGQDDLPVETARSRLPGKIVGLSTHSTRQIDSAVPLAPDYIAVGPVFETPTKPGREAVGLDPVRHASAHVGFPWFAIGGIDARNLEAVVAAGATRIVVVRAITEARDPATAASEMRAILDEPRP